MKRLAAITKRLHDEAAPDKKKLYRLRLIMCIRVSYHPASAANVIGTINRSTQRVHIVARKTANMFCAGLVFESLVFLRQSPHGLRG